jgi:peptidoglycan/LPS O-acetylase OafA/YrhL
VLCADPAGLLRNVLASGPMVLIGRLSYSIYLFHLLARTPGEAYFGSPYNFGSIASGLLLTSTIAAILYVFVERPTARLRRRFRRDDSRGSDAIGAIASTRRQSARRNARTAALALDHPHVSPRGAP